METYKDLPILSFETQEAWRQWLDAHHGESSGIWLRYYKKGAGKATIVYAEALEVALCYGWIDSQSQKWDEISYLQKYTPRRKRSIWSQVNVEKVGRLIEQGLMQPAGLREIEAAKADGRWDAAYASFSQASVPEDLQAELDKHPEAKAFFESLNKTQRYSFITRISLAKKPETRARRLGLAMEKLKKGEKF